jgi:hypothetical protein
MLLRLPGSYWIVFLTLPCFAASPDGAAHYKERCALWHDRSAETRAPAPAALRQMAAANIVKALELGLMKEQGAALSAEEKLSVAEFLSGKIGSAQSKMCAAAPFTMTGPQWNGWGADRVHHGVRNFDECQPELSVVLCFVAGGG